jgi:CMP-N,N'-diacetyllegionaminic acid synthase
MKLLALIPARGGSKGVPRKNLRPLAGKPLILYTVEVARASGSFAEICVSTDDPEVAAVTAAQGLPVPALRPPALAADDTPMLDVVRHVLGQYRERGTSFDAVALLQPTAPLRTVDQLKAAIDTFAAQELDSLISVVEVPAKFNPHWVYVEREPGLLHLFCGRESPIPRRQDLPPAYIREGSIYLFRTQTLDRYGNVYGKKIGFFLVTGPTVNIDTEEDFAAAERLLAGGRPDTTSGAKP